MKNYPLNPYIDQGQNWHATYLTELNAKIVALKHYSDFFLTDFIQVTVPLETLVNYNKIVKILSLNRLDFHNYLYVTTDCYIETDFTDPIGVLFQNGRYYRLINAGTIIVSNARPEGGIDSTGISKAYLMFANKQYVTLNKQILSFISKAQQGPANEDRTHGKNFFFQPAGYASFYVPEAIEGGLKFQYYEKGGEEYGTQFPFTFILNNARVCILSDLFTKYSASVYGLKIPNRIDNATQIHIVVNNFQKTVPGTARSNPPMYFHFYGRNRADELYGEEIILDSTGDVSLRKIDDNAILYYNISLSEDYQDQIILKDLQADLI